MQIRRLTLTLTAFLALLALPLAAEAQAGRRSPEDILHNPRALARYLKLTAEQIAATRTLQQELKVAVDPLREAQKGLREALRAEIEAASPNACEVGEAALALRANREQIRAELEELDDKFSALLTPEQLARYEALKEAARHLRGGEDE